jgi:glycosyltransferase involved in cell wall biosynthesis
MLDIEPRQSEVKIAQVCPRYYPDIGGVETHVKEISERLLKRGFEVEVICTDPAGHLHKREMINGVAVTRFRSFAPGEAYYFSPQIYFYLKRHDFDLIHAHSYHAMPSLFAMLAKNGRRLIFTPHYHRSGHTLVRDVLLHTYRSIGRKIFEKADKVICVSEYERQRVIMDFGISENKIEKIPNGLNLRDFIDLKRQENNDAKTILYVGRLEKYKGVQYIIKALP